MSFGIIWRLQSGCTVITARCPSICLKAAWLDLFIQNSVSKFWSLKFRPLFWVKIPFSWGSNHNHGIFCLAFLQVAKIIQILLFLSEIKPQLNSLHKNQPLLHTPTKRNFYHLHYMRLTKPQLAAICSTPVRICLAICTVSTLPWLQFVHLQRCFVSQF